jgi:hypothetical protein
MGIEEIDKKEFLKMFLSDLFRIANKEYQKRVWIEGRGPECDDFDETVNCFFDDGEIVMNHYIEFGITEVQYLLLKTFWDEFRSFSNGSSAFLDRRFLYIFACERLTEVSLVTTDHN